MHPFSFGTTVLLALWDTHVTLDEGEFAQTPVVDNGQKEEIARSVWLGVRINLIGRRIPFKVSVREEAGWGSSS